MAHTKAHQQQEAQNAGIGRVSNAPPVNPDLGKFLGGLGLQNIGGEYEDPDDPIITIGRKPIPAKGANGYLSDADLGVGMGKPYEAFDLTPDTRKKSELINGLYTKKDVELRELQTKLIKAGFLDKKKVVPGRPDPATRTAYSQFLDHAGEWNEADPNMTSDEMLQELAIAGTEEGNAFSVTNPEDIIATAKDVSMKLLGRQISDAEAQKFVAGFQSVELGYQQAAMAQEDALAAGQNVVVTKAPDAKAMEAQLAKDIRAANPQEAEATDYMTAASEFQNLIRESANRVKQY